MMLKRVDRFQEPDMVENLASRSDCTPDFRDIKKQDHHMVFMYGRLRLGTAYGLKGYELFKNCKYFGIGGTATEYTVRGGGLNASIPSLAFPLNTIKATRPARLIGDVWAVTPTQLASLDYLLDNTEEFTRKSIHVFLYDQERAKAGFRPSVKCWVYFANPDRFRDTFTKTPQAIYYGKKGNLEYDILKYLKGDMNDKIPF